MLRCSQSSCVLAWESGGPGLCAIRILASVAAACRKDHEEEKALSDRVVWWLRVGLVGSGLLYILGEGLMSWTTAWERSTASLAWRERESIDITMLSQSGCLLHSWVWPDLLCHYLPSTQWGKWCKFHLDSWHPQCFRCWILWARVAPYFWGAFQGRCQLACPVPRKNMSSDHWHDERLEFAVFVLDLNQSDALSLPRSRCR